MRMMAVIALSVMAGGAMAAEPPQPESAWQPPWQAAAGPEVTRALLLDALRVGDRVVTLGERGIVLYSDDAGDTWQQAEVPTSHTLTDVEFVNGQRGWAVGHDAIVLRTDDGGATWQQAFSAPQWETPLLRVWFADERRGFAVGGRGHVLRTVDGGETWLHQVVMTDDGFDAHLFDIKADGAGTLTLAAEAGTFYRSDDDGETWQMVASPYPGSQFGLLQLPGGDLLAYAMLGNALRRGASPEPEAEIEIGPEAEVQLDVEAGAEAEVGAGDVAGDSGWRLIDTGVDKSFMTGQVRADGTVLLAGLSGAIAVSRDGGQTFSNRSRGDRVDIAAMVDLGDDLWLLFGSGGIRKVRMDLL